MLFEIDGLAPGFRPEGMRELVKVLEGFDGGSMLNISFPFYFKINQTN